MRTGDLLRMALAGLWRHKVRTLLTLSGVIAGTLNHFSRPFPRIEVDIERDRMSGIRGGGAYGAAWRELEGESKDTRYPCFPAPGLFLDLGDRHRDQPEDLSAAGHPSPDVRWLRVGAAAGRHHPLRDRHQVALLGGGLGR